MIPIWKENFKVTSYQVDFQENIKPTNLMQLFQEAAGNHAQHLILQVVKNKIASKEGSH